MISIGFHTDAMFGCLVIFFISSPSYYPFYIGSLSLNVIVIIYVFFLYVIIIIIIYLSFSG